jgi:hypothetical protein
MERRGFVSFSVSSRLILVGCCLLLLAACSSAPASGGVPWGPNDIPPDLYGDPYTGSKVYFAPARAVEKLEEARAAEMHVIVKLAGRQEHYVNPDGTFNLELWKAQVDRYRDVPFDEYVADGTVVAHQIVSEAKAPDQFGGTVIPNDVLDEMAAYSTSIWPTMPTLVRADATELEDDAAGVGTPSPGWTWRYLDAASSRYLARKGDPAAYAEAEQASADRQGIALAMGLNVLSGGDGSSGFPSPELPGAWAMSADELRTYTAALLEHSEACSFEMWKYFSTASYFTEPAIEEAMDDVAEIAAGLPTHRCEPPDRATASASP